MNLIHFFFFLVCFAAGGASAKHVQGDLQAYCSMAILQRHATDMGDCEMRTVDDAHQVCLASDNNLGRVLGETCVSRPAMHSFLAHAAKSLFATEENEDEVETERPEAPSATVATTCEPCVCDTPAPTPAPRSTTATPRTASPSSSSSTTTTTTPRTTSPRRTTTATTSARPTAAPQCVCDECVCEEQRACPDRAAENATVAQSSRAKEHRAERDHEHGGGELVKQAAAILLNKASGSAENAGCEFLTTLFYFTMPFVVWVVQTWIGMAVAYCCSCVRWGRPNYVHVAACGLVAYLPFLKDKVHDWRTRSRRARKDAIELARRTQERLELNDLRRTPPVRSSSVPMLGRVSGILALPDARVGDSRSNNNNSSNQQVVSVLVHRGPSNRSAAGQFEDVDLESDLLQ